MPPFHPDALRRRLLLEELATRSAEPFQGPRVLGRRDPAARAATFATDVWLDVPPTALVALVREADLGPLAGDLSLWEVRSSEDRPPFTERLLYVSRLPWPFRDRAFCVVSEVHLLESGAVRIASASVDPDPAEEARVSGARWASVTFSGYHLRSERGGARMVRVIEVDLAMGLPARLELALLKQVYTGNHKWLAGGRARAERPDFAARMSRAPVYAAITSHVQGG